MDENTIINGVFFLLDVDVLPGSVLELGPDLGVFAALNIRIWKGGTISLLRGMSLDCASIVGEYTDPFIPQAVGSIALLGAITNN